MSSYAVFNPQRVRSDGATRGIPTGVYPVPTGQRSPALAGLRRFVAELRLCWRHAGSEFLKYVMRVNLVAFENGVGNSRDVELLKVALTKLGADVTLTQVTRHARRRRKLLVVRVWSALRRWWSSRLSHTMRRYDVTVMLEHIWPEQAYSGARCVVVPNPEFFDRHDQRSLSLVDGVWAKTRCTEALFATRVPVEYIGFDSVDRLSPEVTRQPTFLHLAGRSRMKGASLLLSLWARHPTWPTLNVVHSLPNRASRADAANIRYYTEYLDDIALRVLQNQSLYHVCTSETEGWGHYIAEAAAVGAIVIATDAPPMNELVDEERGFLIASAPIGKQNLATKYGCNLVALESAIQRVIGLSTTEQERYSTAARAWFVKNSAEFPARLSAALR